MKFIWYSINFNSFFCKNFNILLFFYILLSVFYMLNIVFESMGNIKLKKIMFFLKELLGIEILYLISL